MLHWSKFSVAHLEQIAPEQNAHGEQITPEQGFAQIEQIAPVHEVAHREHFCSGAICSL